MRLGLLAIAVVLTGCVAASPGPPAEPRVGRPEDSAPVQAYDEFFTTSPEAPEPFHPDTEWMEAPAAYTELGRLREELETGEGERTRLLELIGSRDRALHESRIALSARETELARLRQELAARKTELTRLAREIEELRLDLEKLKNADMLLERKR